MSEEQEDKVVEQDNETGATKSTDTLNTKKHKSVIIVIICLILVAAGIFYFWHKNTAPKVQEDVSSAIATVDIHKLMEKHPDYPKLVRLQIEKMMIFNQLKNYAVDDPSLKSNVEITPAENVFSEVVQEQDNLRNIKSQQQLKEETAAKENELRNKMADERNSAIQELSNRYLNEILNCTVKLDNAKNLRMTQDEKQELLARLETLKKQRGQAVYELEQQFNMRIAKELMDWRQQRAQELGMADASERQKDVEDSQAKQQLEQQRDNQYLQDRLQMMNARKKDSARLLVLLHTKDNEVKLLQKNILKDIGKLATKVAVQKHLKLVVTNVAIDRDGFGNKMNLGFTSNLLNGMVIGVDAEDITDDILNEMQNEQNKIDNENSGRDDVQE